MNRFLSLAIIFFFVIATSVAQENSIPAITVESIAQLELGYAAFGKCRGFSPDGKHQQMLFMM